jgi:hypothetical protein
MRMVLCASGVTELFQVPLTVFDHTAAVGMSAVEHYPHHQQYEKRACVSIVLFYSPSFNIKPIPSACPVVG